MDVKNLGVDVAGGDTVDASVVDPLDGEAFGELDDGGFGRVVLPRQGYGPSSTV